MDNITYAVTNETPENDQVIKFDLEYKMRNIGAEEGAFVLGILDCCREKIPLPKKAGNVDLEGNNSEEVYSNCVISFGCPPSKTVNADSKIAVEYFEKLRQCADPQDGSVLVPGDLFYRWKPNQQGETLAMANDDLVLVHTDWNAQPYTAVEQEEEKVNEDEEQVEESKAQFGAAQQ